MGCNDLGGFAARASEEPENPISGANSLGRAGRQPGINLVPSVFVTEGVQTREEPEGIGTAILYEKVF